MHRRDFIQAVIGAGIVHRLNAIAAQGSGAPLVSVVDSRMLQAGGDCLDDEILGWERLRAERRVAVSQDNSAPVVCRDRAGQIYLMSGTGRLFTSSDDGKSYDPAPEIVVGRRPVTDAQALGVLKSRRLVIAHGDGGRLLTARSEDGGQTWRPAGELVAAGFSKLEAGGVRIVALADGTLLLAASAWKSDGTGDAEGLLYSSSDEGKTWSRRATLGPRCAGANLLQLKSGELLAAITYQGTRKPGDPGKGLERDELFNNVVVARSSDDGRTWREFQCVTRFKEAPADLLQLSDGSVVLVYGQQNSPFGARAILSRDGGKTWGRRVYILGFSTIRAEWYSGALFRTAPGWRTSSVALQDNTVLTLYTRGSLVLTQEMFVYPGVSAWYQKNRVPGEKGKAILSVRWSLDGMKKPPLGVPVGMTAIAKPNAQGYLDNGRRWLNPEHLNEGGDYFHQDEILVFERIHGEHAIVGPGSNPTVCLDPQGNPVAASVQGSIYRSSDQGRHWELIGRTPQGGIQSFGLLRDGTMLAASSVGAERRVDVFRSEDGGETWSDAIRIDPSPFDFMGAGNCMRINQLPDGTVLMTCGNLFHSKLMASEQDGVFRSRDGGKTWGDFSYIGLGCETNILRLRSGRLLAAIRDQGSPSPYELVLADEQNSYRNTFLKNTSLSVSDDNGYTWSRPWTVTRYFECPADLVEMPDGALVLTYMQKNRPDSARAMVSRDQGKTWSRTLYMLGLLGWRGKGGGHTSSVLLKDGRVLTVGSGWSTELNSHVSEATIWKPLGDS
ncbi:MAG: exo-alpha-sialidase [Acidimicrobiia bacterium]|nr:exo-alpha-sialidase [Acidimicrobiia bacterium]